MQDNNSFDVIPAIDLINNKCIRLTQGDYNKKIEYHKSPLEYAIELEKNGTKRLHLVDLAGAKKGQVVHWNILKEITTNTNLKVDFSGGLRTEDDVEKALEMGATYVAIGSLAIKEQDKMAKMIAIFGEEKFILSCDVRDDKIQISGWTEQVETTIFDFILQYSKKGLKTFFSTDISKDGMMEGVAISYYKTLIETFPEAHIIASGGVSHIDQVKELKNIGCSGVILGKSLLEGTIKFSDLKTYLN